jgi:hypothetical protein
MNSGDRNSRIWRRTIIAGALGSVAALLVFVIGNEAGARNKSVLKRVSTTCATSAVIDVSDPSNIARDTLVCAGGDVKWEPSNGTAVKYHIVFDTDDSPFGSKTQFHSDSNGNVDAGAAGLATGEKIVSSFKYTIIIENPPKIVDPHIIVLGGTGDDDTQPRK